MARLDTAVDGAKAGKWDLAPFTIALLVSGPHSPHLVYQYKIELRGIRTARQSNVAPAESPPFP